MIGKRVKIIIEFVKDPIEVVKHIIYKYKAPDGSIVWAEADLPEGIYRECYVSNGNMASTGQNVYQNLINFAS